MNKQVVLIGGSGFIGTKLTDALITKGYDVLVIDRHAPRITCAGVSFKKMDFSESTFDAEILVHAFGVINLAGAPIGKRWNEAYKKELYRSRIHTTRSLITTLGKLTARPSVLINASAAGYYGDAGTTVLTEESPPGTDFLAKLCVDWEAEALRAEALGMRTVRIRTANVLGPGGLLEKLRPLFRFGLGGYFGNGSQYMPWIHWRDIVGIYIFALEHPISGAFNVGSGETPTQKTLFKTFGRTIHAPWVLSVPRPLARLILGEFSGALFASERTVSNKIKDAGYTYEITDLTTGLQTQ